MGDGCADGGCLGGVAEWVWWLESLCSQLGFMAGSQIDAGGGGLNSVVGSLRMVGGL